MSYSVVHGVVLKVEGDSEFWVKTNEREVLIRIPGNKAKRPVVRESHDLTIAGSQDDAHFIGLMIQNNSTQALWSHYAADAVVPWVQALLVAFASHFVRAFLMFIPVVNWVVGLPALGDYMDAAQKMEIAAGRAFKMLLKLFVQILKASAVITVVFMIFVAQKISGVGDFIGGILIGTISLACSVGLGVLFLVGLAQLFRTAADDNRAKYQELSALLQASTKQGQ